MSIIRTKTRATGGITADEKKRLDAVVQEWIGIAMRTDPIEPDKIVPAIKGLYKVAELKEPRVVIVPSPLVMAFAYGASAWIWHCRKNNVKVSDATYTATHAATDAATVDATYTATYDAIYTAAVDATDAATHAAIYDATRAAAYDAIYEAIYTATYDATHAAIYDAIYDATYDATVDATDAATYDAVYDAVYTATGAAAACRLSAGAGGIECAKRWNNVYQSGNMLAGWCSYLAGFRDAIGLDLPEYAAYQFYEDAARHGGFRVMHEEFCIVSDFPEIIKKDEQNRPHCEDGPSHRWRDGWSLYHWHGVRVPDEWIKNKSSLTAQTALSQENVELRRAACEILGWAKVLKELNAKLIDADGDPEIGELLEVDLPESGKERFLKVQCGTGREFAIPVPPEMQTAIQASAWTYGIDELDTYKPEVRT